MLEVLVSSITRSVIGFSIVFGVLLFLVIGVMIMNWLDNKVSSHALSKNKEEESKMQTVDDTTLVIISAAVATYFGGRARVNRIRVLPNKAKSGGTWAVHGRMALQGSHTAKK